MEFMGGGGLQNKKPFVRGVLIFSGTTQYHKCSSRKNPYPLQGGSSEIPRGRGVLKAKILEAKYEAKLELLGGGGCKTKKPSVGGVWIYSQ